jgi:prepilin-type N-terminal cleavage/methylation domain-containing protein
MKQRDRSGRAGFTMIELLAVILVLGILMTVLLLNMGGVEDSVRAKNTRGKLAQLEGSLRVLEHERGDFAPSTLAEAFGTAPNTTNMGAECLYLALCADGAPGFGVYEDRLVNTDGDVLARRATGFEAADLFEIHDDWDNPIAYFHWRDYGRKDTYVTTDANGIEQSTSVEAKKNDKTQRWANPTTFQLISAGPDGIFGLNEETGENDDITN